MKIYFYKSEGGFLMYSVIGVRFRNAGKIYYFDPVNVELHKDDMVIVETSRGLEIGKVVEEKKEITKEEVVKPLKKVIRKATKADFAQLEENKRKEEEAFNTCLKSIAEHKMDMKLIRAEYTFDRSKIIFYFIAEGRIDFRELVKELASIFQTRIELRQIGVRDEAKLIGGMGPCGRPFCCTTFLEEFESVSIRMAKNQNLSLNPTKISGVCGRLMCCLRFEDDTYEEVRGEYPGVGSEVITPDGEGKVVSVNMVKETVQVELKELQSHREFPLEEVDIIED